MFRLSSAFAAQQRTSASYAALRLASQATPHHDTLYLHQNVRHFSWFSRVFGGGSTSQDDDSDKTKKSEVKEGGETVDNDDETKDAPQAPRKTLAKPGRKIAKRVPPRFVDGVKLSK